MELCNVCWLVFSYILCISNRVVGFSLGKIMQMFGTWSSVFVYSYAFAQGRFICCDGRTIFNCKVLRLMSKVSSSLDKPKAPLT